MMEASVSGLRAGMLRMSVSAHNVANLNTEGGRALSVRQTEQPDLSGVRAEAYQTESEPDLLEETAGQMTTSHYLKAQASAIRTQDEMLGSIINIMA